MSMKTVFITGGSRGIGSAAVRKFYNEGWKVAFCYRHSEDKAQQLVKELPGVIALCGDIADADSANRLCREALEKLGHIDALVLNAAAALPQKLITDVTLDEWDSLFAADLRSVFVMTKAILPDMINRKSGSIVTLSSMWGEVGGSCEVAYSAAKAGVIGFTKALAKEVGPSGIRVNCVSPGVINTDMNAHLSDEDMQALADETPLCALGAPEQVADAIYMLCSNSASFITGQVLGVNGGLVI